MNPHSSLLSLPVALVAIFAALFIGTLTVLAGLHRSGRERDLAGRIEQLWPAARADSGRWRR